MRGRNIICIDLLFQYVVLLFYENVRPWMSFATLIDFEARFRFFSELSGFMVRRAGERSRKYFERRE